MAHEDGLITGKSAHDVDETTRRFCTAAQTAGLIIFATVDHGRGAKELGMVLRPMQLVIFGHPRGGTPLMQINPITGIDLPFKALIWEDEQGTAWLTYNDPEWLQARHRLGDGANASVAAIAAGIEKLVAAACT